MAIKKLRFGFDIDIADLLALVATRNDALHIDVIGDGKEPKMPKALRNGAAQIAGLIEGPKGGRGQHPKIRGQDEHGHAITGYQVIAKALMASPNHTVTTKGLREGMKAHGLNEKSISPQISVMTKEGHTKRVDEGTYKMTPQGARAFMKMFKERDARIAEKGT